MYSKVAILTDVKFIPLQIMVLLARMYKYVCVYQLDTADGFKKAVDKAYMFDNTHINPIPVYVYTKKEVSSMNKIKLLKYCEELGITDVCFKVHV